VTTERARPRLWPDTAFYWQSGADGRWRFAHCTQCERIVHPPVPLCPHCGCIDVEPRPVSGHATVHSFSVVHQAFVTWLETPYVLALVAPDEDPEVHVTTRIVGCPPEDVHIDMRVVVDFEQDGEIFLPVFRPLQDGAS
jgi:uncharacterized OB-fold protein